MKWACTTCQGHALSTSVVRRTTETARYQQLWQGARKARAGSLACPACDKPMAAPVLDGNEHGGSVELDACLSCHLVWFDRGERSTLGNATIVDVPEAPPEPELPPEAARILGEALAQIERARVDSEFADIEPDIAGWQNAAAFVGLPVELSRDVRETRPYLTWLLLALIVAALFATGLRWSLLASLYLAAVFADNVEDVLGPVWFVVLLAASAGLGVVAGLLTDYRDSRLPIDAAIMATLTMYVLHFPHARLGTRWAHWSEDGARWFAFAPIWFALAYAAFSMLTALHWPAETGALVLGAAVGAGIFWLRCSGPSSGTLRAS
ncbi:MAG: membrane associated rhomboid family serine protease [Myxococcota bacterium]|jgi:membrane associated rhomboid family serine protease